MPGLIIFDCDGVILESEIISCTIDAEELTKVGFPYTAADVAERFVGLSLKSMLQAIEEEHGRPLPPGFADHLKVTTAARFDRELTMVEGIDETLDRLSLPRCVASSSDVRRLRHSLGLVGLYDRLAPHIFGSEHVQNGKPAPDLFLHAAATMGVDARDCVVVEDSPVGVQAGRAAGMHVLGFAGAQHCSPGYGDRLKTQGAHHVFDAMHELPSLIDALG